MFASGLMLHVMKQKKILSQFNLVSAGIVLQPRLFENQKKSFSHNFLLCFPLLVDNNLIGQIPRELSSLVDLEIIDYNGNVEISGTIPTELGMIDNLRELILSGNSLTGEIPDALCGAMSLQVLDLLSNMLTGVIPPCLVGLPEIRTLMLDVNMLNGQIPSEIGPMSELGKSQRVTRDVHSRSLNYTNIFPRLLTITSKQCS